MFVDKTTTLNRTLAIDSPLQTFTVGLLIEFIDYIYHCFLQKRFPRRVNQRFSYIMRTLLYLSGWNNYLHKHIDKYCHLVCHIGTVLGSKSTTVASPFADQTTSRIAAELGKTVKVRLRRSCYRDDVKKE